MKDDQRQVAGNKKRADGLRGQAIHCRFYIATSGTMPKQSKKRYKIVRQFPEIAQTTYSLRKNARTNMEYAIIKKDHLRIENRGGNDVSRTL